MNVYPKISTHVSKLGPNIATVNLPPIITCRDSPPCASGCYAKRGNFRYKKIIDCLYKNLEAYQSNPIGFFNVIDHTLYLSQYRYFRYHSSGDIPDAKYLELMCKLARKHRSTKFLCFTKKYELVNNFLCSHSKPANLILVFSNWGEWKCDNPYRLPEAYVKLNKNTEIPSTARVCPGFCGECVFQNDNCWNLQKGESVWFKKH